MANNAFREMNDGQRMPAVQALVMHPVTGQPVAPPASATPSASFARPADTTAYAAGDLVANSVTAGSVVPLAIAVARANGGTGRLIRARVAKSGTSLTAASFRVHLYRTAPTVANGDNGAWLTTIAGYLGAFDVTMDRAFSDGAMGIGAPLTGAVISFVADAGVTALYALIEARAAYTPVSGETFTVTLEADQD